MKVHKFYKFTITFVLVLLLLVVPKQFAQAQLAWFGNSFFDVVKEVDNCLAHGGCDPTEVMKEVDNCLVHGGCDPTDEENWNVISEKFSDIEKEVRYCFDEGDCNVTERKTWERYLENVKDIQQEAEKQLESKIDTLKELENYVDNPAKGVRKSFELFGKVADLALDGWVSDNFGHVTNKKRLKSALERDAIVIYAKEIDHDEYEKAAYVAALSVASGNPAPMGKYFLDLAEEMVDEFVDNAERAVKKAPDELVDHYGRRNLSRFKNFKRTFSADPLYFANTLATYISTGELPDLSKMIPKVDPSEFSVRFGILSYNRSEKFFDDEIPMPNTHQPYIAITMPDLLSDLDDAVQKRTYSYDMKTGEKEQFAKLDRDS